MFFEQAVRAFSSRGRSTLTAAELLLTRAGVLKVRHDSPHGVPVALLAFENLYDPPSGAWRATGAGVRGFFRRNAPLLYDAVEMEVGHFYHSFVRMTGVRQILETGVSRGYSTLCLASALRRNGEAGHLWAIDPYVVPHIWEGTGLEPVITYVPKRSQDALADVRGLEFDLLVVDSLHDYETCVWEVVNFERQLRVGGYLLLHDSIYFAGVHAVVEQLQRNPRFAVVTLPTPRRHGTTSDNYPGLTVVRKLQAGGPELSFEDKYRRWVIYPSRPRQELAGQPVFVASEGRLYLPSLSGCAATLRIDPQTRLPEGLANARFSPEGTDSLPAAEAGSTSQGTASGTLRLSHLAYVEHFEGDTAIVRGYYALELEEEHGNCGARGWRVRNLIELDTPKMGSAAARIS